MGTDRRTTVKADRSGRTRLLAVRMTPPEHRAVKARAVAEDLTICELVRRRLADLLPGAAKGETAGHGCEEGIHAGIRE